MGGSNKNTKSFYKYEAEIGDEIRTSEIIQL